MEPKPTYEELEEELARLKRAEEALLESERKFRILANNTLDSIFIKGADRRFSFVNHAMAELFGCREEDLLGKRPEELFSPEDAQVVTEVDSRTLAGETVSETRDLSVKGHFHTFHTIQLPIRDSRGHVIGISGIVRDVTERWHLLESLRSERDFNASLVDTAQAIILVLDVEGRIVRFNPYMEEISGYPLDVVQGKDWFGTFLPAEDRDRIRALFRKAVGNVQTRGNVNPIVTRDGSKRYIEWHDKTLKDADGETVGVLSIGQDISDRKRAEDALRQEKEFTDTALDAQLDTFFLFDPATGKAVRWNRAFRSISGYTDEEIASMPAPDAYYGPEDLARARSFVREVLKEGSGTIELDMVCRNGRKVPTEYRVSVVDDERGQPRHLISIGRDVTDRKQADRERKELEEQLRQAQKMEAIGTLAGGIAHDFNNILGVIVGNTELALGSVPERNPVRPSLEEVLKASLRGREMVRQILSFSRKTKQALMPVRMGTIVEDSLRLVRHGIPTTIEIRQSLSTPADTVLADPTQIHQVLINLCANAAHAMREKGGILTVGLERTDLHEQDAARGPDVPPGPYIALTVSDTGRGMEPDILGRIFDPYFTTKGVDEGTGMGLSVVHGIVKSHGGSIRVESEPGKGSRFRVLLPLLEAAVTPAPGPPVPLPTGSERVLFVDDEEAIADVGRRILARLGYRVTAMTDSREALEAFRSDATAYDVLVTDMTMPNRTGTDLAREILNIRPGFPVILCSGHGEIFSEDEARRMGIAAFLGKPFVVREIAETVRRVLDREKP